MMKNTIFNRTFFLCILSALPEILLSQSQLVKSYSSSEGFVAHEWGTFTTLRRSNGELLSGLEREEETLPRFVNNLCFCYEKARDHTNKGFSSLSTIIKNVTVKMETPVIYFYNSQNSSKTVTVNIGFKNGSISQWYPQRNSGEVFNKVQFLYPYNFITVPITDFAAPRTGSIQWNIDVLPANDTSSYSSNPLLETPLWRIPRLTASNKLKSLLSEQVEKYLFYRGIGNFVEPIKISFNTSHNLVIHNTGTEKFTYILVYERKRDNSISIWWSGSISGNQPKVVQNPVKNSTISAAQEMEKFVIKLMSAGLYEDEARAMLKTWEKSYFEHEGLKVFWIVPRQFTEEILPIKFDPNPDDVNRVLIGRSEILTPEFEQELFYMDSATFISKYKDDRFFLAYTEVRNSWIPTVWTDYNLFSEDEIDPDFNSIPSTKESDSRGVNIYPNPVKNLLVLDIFNTNELVNVKIFSSSGEQIYNAPSVKTSVYSVNTDLFRSGVYTIKVEYNDGFLISRKLFKD
jgi:hypothetical protein